MRRAPAVAGSRALPAQQLGSTSLLRRTCGISTSCRAPAGGLSYRPFQSNSSSSTQCHVQHRRQSLICRAHRSKGGSKGGSSKGGAGSSTSVLTHPDSSSPDSTSSSSTGGQAQAAAEAPGPRQPVPVVGDVAVAQPPRPGPASGDAAAAAGAAAAALQSGAAGTGSSGNESSSSSSSKLNVMSFDEEDIDSISDMYAVINRASVIVSKQQQEQQGTSAADGVPGSSSGSSGRTFGDPAEPDGADSSRSPADQAAAVAAAQATVMSFDEEDIDSISDMYAVINRASVIVSEQKQQLLLQQQQQQQALSAEGVATPSSSPSSSAAGSPSLSRTSSSGSLSGGLSSEDLAAIAELQTATERKLADLQLVVEELDLEDEEMSQQLTDVLNKLGALEQELSAAVHHSISTSSTSSSDTEGGAAAAPPAPTAAAGAAAAGAALLEPPTAAAAAAGPLAIEHTVELEALAEAASMGARPDTPVMDVLSVPMVPAPTAAAAAAAVAAVPAAAAPAAAVPAALSAAVSDPTKLWPLFVLGLSYVHQATSGFALPALLPMVSPDLHLTDFQGALLTSGYSYLYALALVPVGLLADKVDRPKLLAVGLGLWSMLSIVSSGAGSFAELLIARTGFAVAQAAQNPVSFSLIPDLFPANKSTALAGYNCAIYLGRALSFASVLAAHRVRSGGLAGGAGPVAPVGTMADAAAGAASSEGVQLSMVPLDKLDLQRMSIIYTTGDMAAVTPLYNYNFHVIAYESAAGSEGWRELLRWIGYPGFAIALLMALTVKEPRGSSDQQQQQQGGGGSITDPATWKAGAARVNMQLFNVFTGHGWHSSSSSDKDGASSSSSSSSSGSSAIVDTVAEDVPLAGPACVVDTHAQPSPPLALSAAGATGSAALALPSAADADAADTSGSGSSGAPAAAAAAATALTEPIKQLLSKKSFQATTIAAALNDLGSYALIAWHSTFYERVFGLDSGVYAPMLAVILPVGGILGGVGGGLIADYLSVVGGRYWLTAGASLLAAPFIAQSLLADSPGGSFSALLAGFALSEAWRAPGAIMIRSVAPQELGSTASALYLCIRNLVGGAGPVAVAKLAEVVGLQHAMLLAPACYVVSGLIFLVAEKEIEAQQKAEKLAAQQEAEEQAAEQQAAVAAAKQQQQTAAAVVTEPQQLQAVAAGADRQKQQKQQQW